MTFRHSHYKNGTLKSDRLNTCFQFSEPRIGSLKLDRVNGPLYFPALDLCVNHFTSVLLITICRISDETYRLWSNLLPNQGLIHPRRNGWRPHNLILMQLLKRALLLLSPLIWYSQSMNQLKKTTERHIMPCFASQKKPFFPTIQGKLAHKVYSLLMKSYSRCTAKCTNRTIRSSGASIGLSILNWNLNFIQ